MYLTAQAAVEEGSIARPHPQTTPASINIGLRQRFRQHSMDRPPSRQVMPE